MTEKKDIKSMPMEALAEEMEALGVKKFRTAQLYDWMHVKLSRGFDEMSNLPKDFRKKCKELYTYTALIPVEVQESKIDGTRKFLFGLADGNVVESVWMKYKHGNSVCISSQVGCRMGCRFCASTLDGLERNLTPGEMLDQIYAITRYTGERVSNVVVMGTGEPMDNYDNLLTFIKMLTDEHGLHISQRNITVSTCGLVPMMKKLAEEELQITLALSLHAPNDEKRKELMPIAKKYSLEEVLEACDYYFEKTGRRISFEYALVGGVNDNEREAEEFIVYWLPLMEKNKYNYIRFETIDEINENLKLEIIPEPETLIRINMEFKGLSKPIDVEEQKLEKVERKGYTVVEWGGTKL